MFNKYYFYNTLGKTDFDLI